MKTEKKEQYSYCRSILDDLCRQQIILESQRLKGIHCRYNTLKINKENDR